MPRRLPNGARAVMAFAKKRRGQDKLMLFPTPPWATRALCEVVLAHIRGPYGREFSDGTLGSVWEPACGEGHMSEVLKEYFGKVYTSDAHDYGYAWKHNFLASEGDFADWIITNPPFGKLTEPFILRALDLARVGVAMFVRLQFLEGIGRYNRLWTQHPPTLIAPFAERVPLCKGRWDPDGSTATAYCWLVWVKGREPMPPFWIAPGQRERLTKPDDRRRFAAWSLPQEDAAE